MRTGEAVDVELKKKDQRRKFVKTMDNTDGWFISSSNQPLTDISDEQTKKKKHFEMSEKQPPELLAWNEVMAANKMMQ